MRETRAGWIAVAVVAAVAALFLLAKASEKVGPTPVALWVAIQPEGESAARIGRVEVPPGTGFRLHAVMEAETFRGRRVYYTEAKQLELLGDPVPDELLESWPGRLEARILWFTVEGSAPYREVPADDAVLPGFQEVFQPDWGRAWSVVGDLGPAVENFLPGDALTHHPRRFGTQRFQVRIELFGSTSDLVPELRIASWGAEELPGRSDAFPTVTAALPGALGAPTRVFGLPQIEVVGGGASASSARLAAWTQQLLAFSRITILRNWLAQQESAWSDLSWQEVELEASGATARPGDLVRAGTRLVWVLEDRGENGLDYEDWCLDFERGARVLRLGDVFVGQGLVELAKARDSAGGPAETSSTSSR